VITVWIITIRSYQNYVICMPHTINHFRGVWKRTFNFQNYLFSQKCLLCFKLLLSFIAVWNWNNFLTKIKDPQIWIHIMIINFNHLSYRSQRDRSWWRKLQVERCNIIYTYIKLVRYIPTSRAGIATTYGLDDRGVGVRVPVESRIFSSPDRPDRLWGLSNLLFSGYFGAFRRR
jgi:hypothetical protein